ncbi:MAG: methyltransferase domain-containing protein [Planctomycetes bacterium]|nr:methyltransferase domain-containing protein [Planctomycetota bacterium]
MIENDMGPNALWLTEELCKSMILKPGMRVLDMGCGRAISSIFLAKEFSVQVWATDLWIKASDNWKRIKESGMEGSVFPIHAEAHNLPFAEEFFDAILSIDSYHYYGTSDMYLRYFIKYLKPSGYLGIIVPGLMKEITGKVPDHLLKPRGGGNPFWDNSECWSFHTPAWWKHHLSKTTLVDIKVLDPITDGWKLWLYWEEIKNRKGFTKYPDESKALRNDKGRYLGLVRVLAQKK